jgi:hypothetical protein
VRRYGGEALVDDLKPLMVSLDEVLASRPQDGSLDARVALTRAFLELHVPPEPNVQRARQLVERAMEAGGSPSAEFLATRAEVQHATGEVHQAIVTLEGVLRLPDAKTWHHALLERYRGEIFPDLASFESIDAALASRPSETDQRLIADFQETSRGPHSEAHMIYLAGRVLQRAGEAGEAVETFRSLAERLPDAPVPHVRCAESMAADGRPEDGLRYLEHILAGALRKEKELWECWLTLCFHRLRWTAAEARARFPEPTDTVVGQEESGYAGGIVWLLERLAEAGRVQINCGGEETIGASGAVWGGDRFFLGGEAEGWSYLLIRETSDAESYRMWRRFGRDAYRPGYRVPLPDGPYRLTLHFLEERTGDPQPKTYDVLVEGTSRFPPRTHGRFLWWAAAVRHEIEEVVVEDGFLDITLQATDGSPHIAAIEIEPLN